LARRRTQLVLTKKNATIGQKGSSGVTQTKFDLLGPHNILRTAKAKNSNFVLARMTQSSNQKNAILCQNWSCGCHLTHFWNFGTLTDISGTVEAINYTQTNSSELKRKEDAKLGQTGHMWVT